MSQAQASSQAVQQNSFSISLEKFSFRTSRNAGKSAWNHRVGNSVELTLVIRTIENLNAQGNLEKRTVMQVSHGAEVIDVQDLGFLVMCHKQHILRSNIGLESPVQIATRSYTYLAMSYPYDDVSIHAIQFKFFRADDFKAVETVLKNLDLPTREVMGGQRGPSALPLQLARASPAPSLFSTTSVGTSATLAGSNLSRPASTFRNSPGIPFNPHQPSNIPARWNTSDFVAFPDRQTELTPAISSFPMNIHSNNSKSTSRTADIVGEFPTVQALPQGDPLNHNRLYASQLNEQTNGRHAIHRDLPQSNLQSIVDRPSSGFGSKPSFEGLQGLQQTLGQTQKDIVRSPFFTENPLEQLKEPAFISDILPSAYGNTIIDRITQQRQPSIDPVREIRTPPKRTLPFPLLPKADHATIPVQTANSSLLKPTTESQKTSAIKPPILPPKKTYPAVPAPAKKRVAQRKPTAKSNQTKSATQVAGTAQKLSTTALSNLDSPLAGNKAPASRPLSAASTLHTKANPPLKRPATTQPVVSTKRNKVVDGCTQTECVVSATQSVDAIQSVGGIDAEDVEFAPSEEYLQTIDKFILNSKPRPTPKHLFSTPEYRGASHEDRENMVNDFICRNLQDPNFLQLCKDMENAWRRIGLGM